MEKSTAFPEKENGAFSGKQRFQERLGRYAFFTCLLQQSVMNFGILMSPGTGKQLRYCDHGGFFAAAGQNRCALAYMPVQGLAMPPFPCLSPRDRGAKRPDRVTAGVRTAVRVSILFCVIISAVVWIFAHVH
ncbi:MAG: hypothetical protein ACLUD0_07100 [Eubacterium ramulus]